MKEILNDTHKKEENRNTKTGDGKKTKERKGVSLRIIENLHNSRKITSYPITKASKYISNSGNHKEQKQPLILFQLYSRAQTE